jgi:Tfp pilus assembly protein PilX
MKKNRSLPVCELPAGSLPQATPEPCRESGSAYVLVLVALVVLSLLGLILAMITQSEVEVGANERSANRVFYTSEAGISAAVTNLIVANGISGFEAKYMDQGSTVYGTNVSVSSLNQLNSGPSDKSQINQDSDYKAVTYATTSRATRFGKDNSGVEQPLGSKTLELMFIVTPFEEIIDIKGFKKTSRYSGFQTP